MQVIKHESVDRVTVYPTPDGNPFLQVGRFSYMAGLGFGFIDSRSKIRIGNFCSIGEDVIFFLKTNHHPEWVTTFPLERLPWKEREPFPEDPHVGLRDDVIVGNDVWVGYGAKVMAGSSISDGAVIAAGAVVSGYVRPYAIMAGNPAREVRRRFDDNVVESLLELRWWDLPTERIREISPLLASRDVVGLIGALSAK